jgi:hypothetical protein
MAQMAQFPLKMAKATMTQGMDDGRMLWSERPDTPLRLLTGHRFIISDFGLEM